MHVKEHNNALSAVPNLPGCGSCRFVVALDAVPASGPRLVNQPKILECHRHPPVFVMLQSPQGFAAVFGFPQVQPQTFCYCYEKKHDDMAMVTPTNFDAAKVEGC